MNLGTTAGRQESFVPQITPCKWLRPQKSGPGIYIYEVISLKIQRSTHNFYAIFCQKPDL